MREDLCSIPIHDVFLPKDGCPFCRMRDMLEDRMATYITGAAMMEPDVRVETNRLGFCEEHFNQILARGSRLSVALILESLLDKVREEAFPQGRTPAKKLLDAGLRVCISTDNMTLAAVTLEDEYRHCVADMGFAPDDLRTMARFALDAAFLPEQEKRLLAGRI